MQTKRYSHGQTNSLGIRSIRIEQIVDVCNILKLILSNEKHILKSTHWIIFSPMFPSENDSKRCKKSITHICSRKPKQKIFSRLNEEGLDGKLY